MNFTAGLVDDNYRKIAVFVRVFVAEPPRKLSAMLNRTRGGRKLYANSVPNWNSILHVKIKSVHRRSSVESERWNERMPMSLVKLKGIHQSERPGKRAPNLTGRKLPLRLAFIDQCEAATLS